MKSKMTAVFATLMIALMAVGITYACWKETLTINGVVNTGDLDVKWSWASTNDEGTSDDHGLTDVEYTTVTVGEYSDTYALSGDYVDYEKHVATSTTVITTEVEEDDKLTITIDNAYPSYAPCISFAVDNIGDIPVNMSDLIISYDNLIGEAAGKALDKDGMELIAWEVTMDDTPVHAGSKGTYTNLPFTVDDAGEGIYCLNCLLTCLQNQQIDGGHCLDVHLIFHFEQWLEQGLTGEPAITFGMTATFVQWNCAED